MTLLIESKKKENLKIESTKLTPGTQALPDIPSVMQAAQFYAPNEVRYEQVPIPELSPGDVLVKIGAALTCGTDVKCYRRGHPVLLKHFPSPFGHEFSGTIVAVAPTEDKETDPRFKLGDRVAAVNSAPCDECYYCYRGQHNLCESLDLLNGAYAEYIVVPARIARRNMHRIPTNLPFEKAAFTEPLAVCLHGLSQAGVLPGDNVAVIGLGPIGQLMVRAATLQGAHVTAMARNPVKLKLAEQFGRADALVPLRDFQDPQQIRSQFTPQGRGFDVVIEAVGLPKIWEMAVELVRKGGTVNLFGGCPGGSTVTFSTRRLHYDEIRLVSSFHHTPAQVKRALDLLATEQIDPAPLITHQWDMKQFEEALKTVEAGNAMKIALSNP